MIVKSYTEIAYNIARVPPGDPDYALRSTLLHFNGSNGATTMVDSSVNPKSWLFFGQAKLTTAGPRFGTACLTTRDHSSGSCYVRCTTTPAPGAPNFSMGTGDWFIEGWVWADSDNPASFATLCANSSSAFSPTGRALMIVGGKLALVGPSFGGNGGAGGNSAALDPDPFPMDQWVSVAAGKEGNIHRLWVNGVLKDARTHTTSRAWDWGVGVGALMIGTNHWDGANGRSKGLFDEWRVTKGKCEHTSSYTPRTKEFPNFST